jgi:hypothetical protein
LCPAAVRLHFSHYARSAKANERMLVNESNPVGAVNPGSMLRVPFQGRSWLVTLISLLSQTDFFASSVRPTVGLDREILAVEDVQRPIDVGCVPMPPEQLADLGPCKTRKEEIATLLTTVMHPRFPASRVLLSHS